MAHTSDPLLCPHCEGAIRQYQDVLTLPQIQGMIVVGCAGCRKILGVLPPENR